MAGGAEDITIAALPEGFPGTRIYDNGYKRGQTIWTKREGYFVPAYDTKRRVIGGQIRAYEIPEDEGKYKWLTNPHILVQSGHSELPLTYCHPEHLAGAERKNPHRVNLAEGLLKPLISAFKWGELFIGASSGNFIISPKQLEKYLKASGAITEVVLNPDKGTFDTVRAGILRKWETTKEFLEAKGILIKVRWWGQYTKDAPDIDELDNLSQAELISWGEYLKLAYKYNPELKKLRAPLQPKSRQISEEEWQLQFGVPRDLSKYYSRIKREIQKKVKAAKIAKYIAAQQLKPEKCLAIVLLADFERWSDLGAPLINSNPRYIKFDPEDLSNLPTPDDNNAPIVKFKLGDRLKMVATLNRLGWFDIHDLSDAGSGKSYDYGNLDLSYFDLGREERHWTDCSGEEHTEERLPKHWHVDVNHRNPTVETIESKFNDMASRNLGLKADSNRQTPLGKDFLYPVKPGEKPDQRGTCGRAQMFNILEEKNYSFQHRKDILCATCPVQSECSKGVDVKAIKLGDSEIPFMSGFLGERKHILKESDHIRCHPRQLPQRRKIGSEIIDFGVSPVCDVVTVEEAGRTLKATKVIDVKLSDVERTYRPLAELKPDWLIIFKDFLNTVCNLLRTPKNVKKKFGLNDIEVRGQLQPAYQDLISKFYVRSIDEFIECENPWELVSTEDEAIQMIQQALDQDLDEMLKMPLPLDGMRWFRMGGLGSDSQGDP